MRSVLAIFAFASFFSCSASAADIAPARSIDFTSPLLGLDGVQLMSCVEMAPDNSKCIKTIPMTLGRIAAEGLSLPERGTALADQVVRGKLAARVITAKDADLTADEVKMIKDQIGKLGYTTVAVFHAIELLDPADVK